MKRRRHMTPEEIEREGLLALNERLGVVGAVRFLRLAGFTHGDYTKERKKLLKGLSLEDLIEAARERGGRRKRRGKKG